MKTALILSTAFITTESHVLNREERIGQYVQGFKQIAELVGSNPEFDVFLVDNTVMDIAQLDSRLTSAINQIPNVREQCYFFDNAYGKKNKGAGLIVQWKKILPLIAPNYKYVVHYEPRQQLSNFSFFEHFIKLPGNYFKVVRPQVKRFKLFPHTISQVLTGMFALQRSELEKYCREVSLPVMVWRRRSIETDLYDFIKRNNIIFNLVDSLDLLWHDTANNSYVKF